VIDTSLFPARVPDLRAIVKTARTAAARPDVFRLWTTSEGLGAALDVPVTVELAVGGRFEILFMPEDECPPGKRGSEGCQVLCWVPDRLLACSWNAPPHLAEEREQRTWFVVELEDAAGGGTGMRLTHTGFGSGGRWDEVVEYFEVAWGKLLEALVAHLG